MNNKAFYFLLLFYTAPTLYCMYPNVLSLCAQDGPITAEERLAIKLAMLEAQKDLDSLFTGVRFPPPLFSTKKPPKPASQKSLRKVQTYPILDENMWLEAHKQNAHTREIAPKIATLCPGKTGIIK